MFITFEGTDGSGKSLQAELLYGYLLGLGVQVVFTREPGGTNIGSKIREILLSQQNKAMCLDTEMLLFAASRAQINQEIIQPALSVGKTVICDRYIDSSLAYQGYGRGTPLETIRMVNSAAGWRRPDLTFLLDMDPQLALARKLVFDITKQNFDRMDNQEVLFYEKVHAGYLKLAKEEPSRWRIIRANQNREMVNSDIIHAYNVFTRRY